MRWLEAIGRTRAINPAHITHMEVTEKFSRAIISPDHPQEYEVVAFTSKAVREWNFFVLGTYDTLRDAEDSLNCFLDQIGVIE